MGEREKEKEEEEGKGEEGEGEEEEGEVESPLKSIGNSKEPMVEGFESRPSSLVVSKEHADALQATLHMELSQQTTLPPGERAEKSHDSHVSSSQVSSSALSHLTNDILTYSAQVAMYPEKSESVSEATWLQSQDDGIRPTSPMAVSRVFKVVFLGERKEGMEGRRKEGRGKGVGRGWRREGGEGGEGEGGMEEKRRGDGGGEGGEGEGGWRRRGGGMEEGRGERGGRKVATRRQPTPCTYTPMCVLYASSICLTVPSLSLSLSLSPSPSREQWCGEDLPDHEGQSGPVHSRPLHPGAGLHHQDPRRGRREGRVSALGHRRPGEVGHVTVM